MKVEQGDASHVGSVCLEYRQLVSAIYEQFKTLEVFQLYVFVYWNIFHSLDTSFCAI